MKKIIYFLLLFPTILNSQEFAPVGATWYYSDLNPVLPPPNYEDIPVSLKSIDIDTIQGKPCKKIAGDFGCSTVWPDTFVYLYQEDRKIYFFDSTNQSFHLLYDFSAKSGESWVIENLPNLPESLTVYVDSTSITILDEDSLLTQHISLKAGDMYWDWGDRIFERIGNSKSLFPEDGLCDAWFGSLRCYEDENSSYRFFPYACDTSLIITATKELDSQTGPKIFPNPARDYFHLATNISKGTYDITVFNSVGNRVFEKNNLRDQKITVQTVGWPAGWYVVRVQTGKYVYSQALIVLD